MEYRDAASFLFDLRRYRPKPGTESTAKVLAHLGNPQTNTAFIQVAGSNGKGSTARMVESILRQAGLSVGLYTSPHLDDIRERIRIDGRRIPKAHVTTFVDHVADHIADRAVEGSAPTFFETLTALALWEFGRRDVDVAVLEVGIGGRYDATSVVDPVAAALTSVTLEHTGIIGETIAEIATDKAHVAPTDSPLVVGVTGEALAAAREVAGAVVTVGNDGDVTTSYEGRENHVEASVSISSDEWAIDTRLPLLGAHQATNAGIATVLARQVGDRLSVDVTEEAIGEGLRLAHWPGRFEVVAQQPMVVLDGAHNPGAASVLADVLMEFEYTDLHLVVGSMHDKDHEGIADALPPADNVIATRPDVDRAEDEAIVAEAFRRRGADRVHTQKSVPLAVETAIEDASADDVVIVTGSLYTVAEARPRWTRQVIPTRVQRRSDAHEVLETADVSPQTRNTASENLVHRVLRTRLRASLAHRIRDLHLSNGGECAIGNYGADETVEIVLAGTVNQLSALADTLEQEPDGVATVANDIREGMNLAGVSESPSDTGAPPSGPSGGEQSAGSGFSILPRENRTAVMGVLNVTPDSFHDGGEYDHLEAAVERARAMITAGVDIIDVGGESTRPGADPIPAAVEKERILPVIERIADFEVPISVDTRKANVGEAALRAGADMLNDVSGLADPEMRFLAAREDVPLIIMHSENVPVDRSHRRTYDDVVHDVLAELGELVHLAENAGLDRERIIIDPGLGFGKSAAESFELLSRLDELRALRCPVLVGHSHKSMFERIGAEPGNAPMETVAATSLAVERGVDVIRVHDVADNVAAVRTATAIDNPFRFDSE